MFRFVSILITVLVLAVFAVSCRPTDSPILFDHDMKPLVTNETREIRLRDSLVKEIDSIPFEKPSGLRSTTLIIELYSYHELIDLSSTRFSKEQPSLHWWLRYPRYKKWTRKHKFTEYTGHKTFKKSKEYKDLSPDIYRYVIKRTTKTVVESDSLSGSITSSSIYYLFDRKENKIHGEIKDDTGASLN
jgi:hypothetical protein